LREQISGIFEKKKQRAQVFAWHCGLSRIIASLATNYDMRMLRATDMGAEKVSASWVNLMKKLNPFEIGDNAV
jgi:hypothetical protein